MLKAASYLFYTELLLLSRRSHDWLYPFCFFIVVTCLYPMAFSPDPAVLKQFGPGCVWIAALFASLLSVENIFSAELEDGHLEQLLLSPLPFSSFIQIKLFAVWVVTIVPLLVVMPLIGMFLQLSSSAIGLLCLTLFFGTPILTLFGCLGVALTLGLKQQGVLLGLLILPFVTPLIIFGVNIVQQSEAGFSILGPLAFLAGLSMMTITLLPWVIAETIRIGVDE